MGLHAEGEAAGRSGWSVAIQTGAALAGAMGVGRFVFTPLLPLMEAQAHLTSAAASTLATSNYLGYLIGAVLGIMLPTLSRARLALRVSGVVLAATLAVMPLTHDVAAWAALRGLAGVASAVIFMVAGNTILTELTSGQPHLVGWAYGGVGAGIALSGALVAVVKSISGWQAAWWSSAALTIVLLAAAWFVGVTGRDREAQPRRRRTRTGVAAPPVSPFSPCRRSLRGPVTSWPGRSSSPRHLRHRAVVAVEQRLDHRRRRRRPLLRRVDIAQPTRLAPHAHHRSTHPPGGGDRAARRHPGGPGRAGRRGPVRGHLRRDHHGVPRHRPAHSRPPGRRHPHRRLRDRPGRGPTGRRAHPARRLHQALLVGAGLVLAAGLGSALLRVRFPHLGEAHHRDRGACRGQAGSQRRFRSGPPDPA